MRKSHLEKPLRTFGAEFHENSKDHSWDCGYPKTYTPPQTIKVHETYQLIILPRCPDGIVLSIMTKACGLLAGILYEFAAEDLDLRWVNSYRFPAFQPNTKDPHCRQVVQDGQLQSTMPARQKEGTTMRLEFTNSTQKKQLVRGLLEP